MEIGSQVAKRRFDEIRQAAEEQSGQGRKAYVARFVMDFGCALLTYSIRMA